MPLLRRLLLPLLALLGACATPPPQAPGAAFYVMRHLHTVQGERDPDLLPEGRRMAERLAADWRFGPAPAAIYVSRYKRTLQTAEPLARRLALTPVVYDPADTPALIARVRAGPLPALIVGHSNTVPDIVAQLGGVRPAPLVHEDFGDLWRIGADGTTARLGIAAENR